MAEEQAVGRRPEQGGAGRELEQRQRVRLAAGAAHPDEDEEPGRHAEEADDTRRRCCRANSRTVHSAVAIPAAAVVARNASADEKRATTAASTESHVSSATTVRIAPSSLKNPRFTSSHNGLTQRKSVAPATVSARTSAMTPATPVMERSASRASLSATIGRAGRASRPGLAVWTG